MSAGFALRANASPFATALLGIGGALAGAGAYIFAYLVWRTVDGGVPLQIRATPHNPSGEPGRSPIVQIASRS